jgi:hypothetical protein
LPALRLEAQNYARFVLSGSDMFDRQA